MSSAFHRLRLLVSFLLPDVLCHPRIQHKSFTRSLFPLHRPRSFLSIIFETASEQRISTCCNDDVLGPTREFVVAPKYIYSCSSQVTRYLSKYVADIHRSIPILRIKLSRKDHVEKRGSSSVCQLVNNFILRYVPRTVNFSYLVV